MAMLGVLAGIAVILTFAMFHTRDWMLGFPSALFWAIAGGQAYTLSAATWDIYYLVFFSSLFGMTLFCAFAMHGLRERGDGWASGVNELSNRQLGGDGYDNRGRKKTEEDDIGKVDAGSGDSVIKPSRRTRELHERAAKRRSGIFRKRDAWGEFK